jgi:hypothetical protein
MKPEALSFAFSNLDLAPRRDAVSESFDVSWSAQVPKNSLLLRYHDQIIVTDRQTIGLLNNPNEPFSPWDRNVKGFRASALGKLAITDVDGTVYLWEPPKTPVAVWHATEPGSYFAVSLSDEHLLITRFAKGGDMGDAFAIDVSDGRVLWQLDPGFHIVAATQYGLLAWSNLLDELQCFDQNSGQIRWRTRWEGGSELYGIVDGILWGPGKTRLQRIDCETGTFLSPIDVQDSLTPGGIMDDEGIFHCCRGLNYQKFDLRDNGRRLSFAEFNITTEGPSLGAGPSGMIVTTDERLIFTDQRGGLWVVYPDRPTEPQLIRRASSMISTPVVRQGQLLIAESKGVITAFGAGAI